MDIMMSGVPMAQCHQGRTYSGRPPPTPWLSCMHARQAAQTKQPSSNSAQPDGADLPRTAMHCTAPRNPLQEFHRAADASGRAHITADRPTKWAHVPSNPPKGPDVGGNRGTTCERSELAVRVGVCNARHCKAAAHVPRGHATPSKERLRPLYGSVEAPKRI